MKKNTIVNQIINTLRVYKTLTLSELYTLIKDHSKASIRGNLNRYINNLNNKEKEIIRVGRGKYSIQEKISINRTSKNIITMSCEREFKVINFLTKKDTLKNHIYLSKSNNTQLNLFDKIAVGESVNISNEIYSTNSHSEFIKELTSEDYIIKNEDARKFLKSIPTESVDACITDPPYKCISGGSPKGKYQPSGILSKNDGKIFKLNNIKFEEWVPDLYRVMKKDSHTYIFTNVLNLRDLLNVCEKVGFYLHNLLGWLKPNVTPNRYYMKNIEYVLFLKKGPAKTINNPGSKTIELFSNPVGSKIHETEKPLELVERYLLNSSKKFETLIDPFMGAGVAAIAAIKNCRKFLGCELYTPYFKRIMKRIEFFKQYGSDRRDLIRKEMLLGNL